ncbi:MAG TPA: selenocysteine-specific translation elongation factor [Polyangiaceae bacterium]|jgi:selenocysteine-specific elongation factor
MRRFVIGTAGHVDHGKTTLVRALTGVDTDRLPEEKRRGISIELGFAPLDLADGIVASVVDVPGHRRLVRAMIAGATGMELVMLVVAADEGVMPQTREHVTVCELLGLSRALIVVTKADAVDVELAEVAGEEAKALLGERWRAEVVTCSAKTGAGIERVRAALRRALVELPPPAKHEQVRLGVDRVFTVRGAGTVVTGTLVAGRLATGDALHVVGERGSRETAARSLHVHDAAVDRADAPTRLAINLAGVALDEVRRGDVVTTDARLRATALFDMLLRGDHAVARGVAVTVHVGTAAIPGRVDAVTLAEGGAVARVRMAHPTALAGGDRVVLRGGRVNHAARPPESRSGFEGQAGAVVGGGLVVDARPDRRSSGAKRRTLAAALASLDPDVTARALVESSSPRPLVRDALPARFAVDAATLARAADRAAASREVARVSDHGWIARGRLDALVARARELVRRHHEEAPLDRGLPLETLRARLASGGGRLVAEEVLRVATGGSDARERLAVEGDVVRMPSSKSAAGTEATARAAGLAKALDGVGNAGATEHTLGEKIGAKPAELRAALQKLARDGGATRLGELWFASRVIDEARRKLTGHFTTSRSLTVVEFKALTGLARKQAVAMLEHFDAIGLTRREGDARVLR